MAKRCELSLVMPCLNEEATIKECVDNCIRALKKHKISGEVVVCDNGSTDKSATIARKAGARVVKETRRGYGNACITGMNSARGEYILKLDADGSYDPMEINKFIKYLRKGSDVVMGSRYKGKILEGAMPWSHQYIGNPVMTTFANMVCRAKISDLCCGMKAFSRKAYKELNFQCPGMEFGPETTIKARQMGKTIKEVPIIYHPDGRVRHSNLNQWRDGFRDIWFIFQQSRLFKQYA